MVKRSSGKIIFTASLLTFQGGITVPGYAASKGPTIFLASKAADYVHGSIYLVDGGWMGRWPSTDNPKKCPSPTRNHE